MDACKTEIESCLNDHDTHKCRPDGNYMTGEIWFAVDWGTSNLRIWPMHGSNIIGDVIQSSMGMGSLDPAEYEPELLRLIGPMLPEQGSAKVIICGMAGARQGWSEAPYEATPCTPPNLDNALPVKTHDTRLEVCILPGVKQDTPANVMRGEETQIAGFLAEEPHFKGVICLPGTHSKWVLIEEGAIAEFSSFMTGEIFALLSEQSVLRHGLDVESWDNAAFERAVDEASQKPETVAEQLFSLRADMLLNGVSGSATRSRLSGLLLGLELAGSKKWWSHDEVALIGAPELIELYANALRGQGAKVVSYSGTNSTLAGLSSALASSKLEAIGDFK